MLWLDTRRIVWFLGLTAAVAALAQVLLNANFLVLLLALVSITCGLYGFWLFGVFNLAAWSCLFYMAGNVLIAFYAKTVLLQPLNSNLIVPLSSFWVQTICCFAMFVALILAHWIDVGKPLIPPITDLTVLRLLSTWCLIIGCVLKVVTIIAGRGGNQQDIGGLTVFGNLLYLGIIARTALVMLRSDGKRLLDPPLIVMLGGVTASGVLSTGKGETAYPAVCFVLTVLFFKGRLPWRYVAGLVGGIALYLTITPLMLTFRYMGLGTMSFSKEIEVIETIGPTLLNGDVYEMLATAHEHTKRFAYDYYGGNGKGQLILGRFSSIQQIDPVISATQIRGTLGGEIILDGFRANTPKVLISNKPSEITGFTVIKSLGVHEGGGTHPTVPLAAIVYAAYGMMGIVFIPLATFLAYLLVLKKACWDIRGNIFAIYLLGVQVIGIHAAEFRHFAGFVMRDMPILVITILLMQKLAVFMTRRHVEFVSVLAK